MTPLTPAEILAVTAAKGTEKAASSFRKLLLLSFMAGVYISLGYLACLRISGSMPPELSGLGSFLGAGIFPVGLIAVLLAGGELVTGNMMVVTASWRQKTIGLPNLLRNLGIVTLGNLLGALCTAWFLGHVTGLTEGAYLAKTLAAAAGKVDVSVAAMFFSGIGCNLFVGLGVWLCYGAKSFSGKILAIWFPVTAFVAIGFQHVVANMFVIPAAIFSGASALTWWDFLQNMAIVWLGNLVGGGMLAFVYHAAYGKKAAAEKAEKPKKTGKPKRAA